MDGAVLLHSWWRGQGQGGGVRMGNNVLWLFRIPDSSIFQLKTSQETPPPPPFPILNCAKTSLYWIWGRGGTTSELTIFPIFKCQNWNWSISKRFKSEERTLVSDLAILAHKWSKIYVKITSSILLCIVGELAGGGSVAVTLVTCDRWQVTQDTWHDMTWWATGGYRLHGSSTCQNCLRLQVWILSSKASEVFERSIKLSDVTLGIKV